MPHYGESRSRFDRIPTDNDEWILYITGENIGILRLFVNNNSSDLYIIFDVRQKEKLSSLRYFTDLC